MKCPKCSSDNTRRYSMVWKEGLSTSETTGKVSGSGTGYAYGSNVPVTVNTSGTVSSTTTTQSELSKKCNPPKRFNPIGSFFGMLAFGAGVGAFLWLIFMLDGEASSLWFWVPAALGAAIGVKGARDETAHNRERYPGLHAQWQKKWLCMKCGESYAEG